MPDFREENEDPWNRLTGFFFFLDKKLYPFSVAQQLSLRELIFPVPELSSNLPDIV